MYEEYEKGNSNINGILTQMNEEEQSYMTKLMIDDYEIKDKEKAIDDILRAYEKEKLIQRKFELIKLSEEVQDEEKKRIYERELNDILVKIVRIK